MFGTESRAIKFLIQQYANKNKSEHSSAFVLKCQYHNRQFIALTVKTL